MDSQRGGLAQIAEIHAAKELNAAATAAGAAAAATATRPTSSTTRTSTRSKRARYEQAAHSVTNLLLEEGVCKRAGYEQAARSVTNLSIEEGVCKIISITETFDAAILALRYDQGLRAQLAFL